MVIDGVTQLACDYDELDINLLPGDTFIRNCEMVTCNDNFEVIRAGCPSFELGNPKCRPEPNRPKTYPGGSDVLAIVNN